MKVFSPAALAALKAGDAVVTGAVQLVTAPTPVLVWGGYGALTIAGNPFKGIGDHGLVESSSGALGGAAGDTTLTLSGVDPDIVVLKDLAGVRNAPTVLYRLIFDRHGQTLLDAKVFKRGRLDQLISNETIGGQAALTGVMEGAAKGLGRYLGRLRSDVDQKLNAPADNGFKAVSYAGTKTLYWGGKIPSTATQGAYPAVVANGRFDQLDF